MKNPLESIRVGTLVGNQPKIASYIKQIMRHGFESISLTFWRTLGDANLPTVALIGTSFSRTSGFADFLAHALETPVASFAKDGGAFSGSASEYFASKAFKQTPPRLVIWEIPERDLETPLRNDKEIWP